MSLESMESEIAGLRAKAADLADDYARTQAERSGSTWADGVTLLGIHVRSDEHATTIMLEPR